MSYAYTRTITINHTQVPNTDQSNFPVLVYVNDPTFKTVSNGGHLNNITTQVGGNPVTMPTDLIFTSDSAGVNLIPWEIESYDGVNGILWAWMPIATVSHTADVVFYTFYGDPSITTQQNTGSLSPSNVWDSNFISVHHVPDGTTLQLVDSTGSGNNGTAGAGSTATVGEVDGGVNFNGASTTGVTISPLLNSNFFVWTLSFWLNTTQNNTFVAAYQNNTPLIYAFVGDIGLGGNANQLNLESRWTPGGLSNQSGGITVNDGTWHYCTWAYNFFPSQVFYYFQDGVLISTIPNSDSSGTSGYALTGGNGQFGAGSLTAQMDEVRFSQSMRSPDWIATEYNNQSQPLVFITLGPEALVPSKASSTRILLLRVGI